MRYSGYLLAFDRSLAALRKVDPEAASAIKASLPGAVLRDMAQRERFWAEHEGIVSDVSNAANDTYLKANNQTHGGAELRQDGRAAAGRAACCCLVARSARTRRSDQALIPLHRSRDRCRATQAALRAVRLAAQRMLGRV